MKYFNTCFLYTLVLLLIFINNPLKINAQSPQYYWSLYSTINSQITSDNIKIIGIDTDGSKWIGTFTYGELLHFDGINWTIYNSSNSPIPNAPVSTISVDSNGKKWFGLGGSGQSGGGVMSFDGINWAIYNTSNSGLPTNNILSSSIDLSGKKWFGTLDAGVASFDGTNWNVYNTSNSGLPNNRVRSISVDTDGKVWFATNGGVASFDGVNWNVFNTSNSSLNSNSVSVVKVDKQGQKWFGFGGNYGLSSYDNSTWKSYNSSNSCIPSTVLIETIAIANDNTKWIGGNNTAIKFDGYNCTAVNNGTFIPQFADMRSISIDNNETVWFGGHNMSIRSYGIIAPPQNIAPSANAGGPYNLSVNNSVTLMASGIDPEGGRPLKYDWDLDNDGIFETNGQNVSFPRGLSDNTVLSSALDNNGIKWFGTLGGGVASFDGVKWKAYNTSNSGLLDNTVRSIAIDADGYKWFGTRTGGVAKFDGVNWTIYNTNNSGLLNNYVSTIAIDIDGSKWFGFQGQFGVVRFDGTNWTVYNSSNSCFSTQVGSIVNKIAIDNNGVKWIGTENGAIRLDSTSCTAYRDDSTIPAFYDVRAIAIDNTNKVWFGGTYAVGGGVLVGLRSFDGSTWHSFTTANSGIPDNNIISITIGDDGSKWLGTFNHQIVHFKDNNWTVYNNSNSDYPGGRSRSILIDSLGLKWISTGDFGSTGNGIVTFNGTNWNLYSVTSTSKLQEGGPSSYLVKVKVTDNGGILISDRNPLSSVSSTTINVLNINPTPTPTLLPSPSPTPTPIPNYPPEVGIINAPVEPVVINSTINTSVNFTDQNSTNTHTSIWYWGDNTTSNGVVTESNGAGSVLGNHTYTTPGIYEVKVIVTDNFNSSSQSIYQFIVVYDSSSNGGFVTGAGTIYSTHGSYVPDPNIIGLARFGFVSKYQNGANMPSGNTQFRFQAANLRFESISYDWLVVAGAHAKFKGIGTINSSGNYGFLLTATDGVVDGGGEVDKFRIKIWDKNNNDSVVYDNNLGTLDNSNPTTEINSGNIIIHN